MEYQVYVGGDLSGQAAVGNNNLLVSAAAGSVVEVRSGDPPPVRRREPVEAKAPRPGPKPLGRNTELDEVNRSLDDGIPVQVYGKTGSGRTTFLHHFAHERSAANEVIFLSAAGLSVDDVLQDLFDACYETEGYRPEPPRLRRLMGSVQAVLVVDDFEGTSADFDTLLDAAPACDVVVGSTVRTVQSAGHAIELSGLPEDAGVMLLARELGRELAPDEQDDAVRLCRISDGSPAALVQIAAAVRARGGPLHAYEDSGRVATVLAEYLDEPDRVVLSVLAALVGVPPSAAALQALSGTEESDATNRLERAGLITAKNDGYQLAGPLAERVAQMAQVHTSAARMAEVLTRWLAAASVRDVAKAAPVVVQVLRAAVDAEAYPEAIALARSASPRFALSLRLGAWGDLLELGRTAARAVNDTAAEAYFTHEAGARLASLGKGAAAGLLLGSAAELWRRIGDHAAAEASQDQADSLTHQPSNPPSSRQPAPSHSRALQKAVSHPAVIGLLTTGLIAGGVVYAASRPGTPLLERPSATTVQMPSRSNQTQLGGDVAEPPERGGGNVAEPPGPGSGNVAEPPGPGSGNVAEPPGPGGGNMVEPPEGGENSTGGQQDYPPPEGCIPESDPLYFESGTVEAQETTFYSEICHPNGLDTGLMKLRGTNAEAAFGFTRTSCPSPLLSDGSACTISIEFHPPYPGVFEAEIYIPEAGPPRRDAGYGIIRLYGRSPSAGPPSSAEEPSTPAEP